MSLENKINNELKQAMLSKNESRLTALRAIKSALLLSKTEKKQAEDLDEKEEAKILQKLIKQRKDSAKIYKEQNRTDLFEKEKVEIEVIQEFLPEQMNEAEIREEVQKIISQTQASSIKDMGKVMGMANKALAGKAEGRVISSIVKELLST
ncbi:MAG TPA: GatB/YqeY domain-containing protein [Sphingobacterium sp.]|nr:GatB/YqeY domain-containing protein [Sphingobacterium sp.]